jgi:hypothetical protein
MPLFLKWLGASLLCVLPFWVVMEIASPTNHFKPGSLTVPVSRVEERIGAVASATQRLFTARVSKNPIGDSFLASDPAHLEARDRYLKSVFSVHSNLHRYVDSSHRTPIQYEIKGLTLIGPRALPIDEAARVIGVNATLVYRYRAESHRITGSGSESANAPWKPGLPYALEGFTLVRQGWNWSVREGMARGPER